MCDEMVPPDTATFQIQLSTERLLSAQARLTARLNELEHAVSQKQQTQQGTGNGEGSASQAASTPSGSNSRVGSSTPSGSSRN
ncbi:hypothetical protein K439DRAFT_1635285 [Ramaria rubella]|nr:hypothetical protein K439DRAFT_1635285 [Ramaria rubella]